MSNKYGQFALLIYFTCTLFIFEVFTQQPQNSFSQNLNPPSNQSKDSKRHNAIVSTSSSSSSIRNSTTQKPKFLFENDKKYTDQLPKLVWIPPDLEFSCTGRGAGYFADPDPKSRCQVYHLCLSDTRHYKFLCGIGTVFSMRSFTCDHWYNYNCKNAIKDYAFNDLYRDYLFPQGPSFKKSEENVHEDVEDKEYYEDEVQ